MADVIELRGLRVLGYCGVLPEEIDRRQPLEIDLDLEADLSAAGASDDLGDTIDYGLVCAEVATLVGTAQVALLEHLAARIAESLLRLDERIDAVTVAVRKLRPPVPEQLDTSGVRLRRTRR